MIATMIIAPATIHTIFVVISTSLSLLLFRFNKRKTSFSAAKRVENAGHYGRADYA
jgi:hypothetical protein